MATNSGGPHTLKYGVTVNHVLGVEAVSSDGEIFRLGGPNADPSGLDLAGVMVGSEGTLAVVTRVWVRLTRNPEGVRTLLGVFDSVDDATNAILLLVQELFQQHWKWWITILWSLWKRHFSLGSH